MGRVLLADDDSSILRTFRRLLEQDAHQVTSVSNGVEALQALISGPPFEVIVTDLDMPGITGIEFLRSVRAKDLDVPVLLVSGAPTLQSALDAVRYGAIGYLTKPVDAKELKESVTKAVRLHSLAQVKRKALELLGDEIRQFGEQAALDAAFEKALGKLWLAYQPIVSWRERRLFAYEALVRSDEPSLSSPPALLDAAERLGRLCDLSRAIRERAVAGFQEAPKDASLFVNLHPSDLEDDQLFDPKAPLTQIASRVVLEITERKTLESIPQIESRVKALRELGFRVAVDDLGAGYAGLGHFALLEPDVVKIDMSLVRGIDSHDIKRSVVGSMMQLCKDLGMLVICEGVETAAERDALAALGCDLLQGYLFARPSRGLPMAQW